MKTLTLDDRLYSALEEQAETTGRAIDELATEAIELWLAVGDLDEEELAEIEAAVRDWEENGGNATESGDSGSAPYSFFHIARNMNLDGPPDWSARLDEYLYGEPCDARDRRTA